MEHLFGDRLNCSGIFADKAVLRAAYVPEHLPHRKEQIQELADILSVALNGEKPPNILIYGKAGTGKTATIKYLGKKFEEAAQRRGSCCSIHYINCKIFDTQYRIFAYLARIFIKRVQMNSWPVPMTGWSTDRVYAAFKIGVDTKTRVVIIVLDDIENLASKGAEALYHLTRVNRELRNAQVSLIGTSNDLTLTDLLDPRVTTLLSEKEIFFPSYCAEQLKDLLYERASIAFEHNVLADTVIPLCAALAEFDHGDARRALDLLCISGEIAERARVKKVTEEHVRQASEQLDLFPKKMLEDKSTSN